jgi:hypothetical protein
MRFDSQKFLFWLGATTFSLCFWVFSYHFGKYLIHNAGRLLGGW